VRPIILSPILTVTLGDHMVLIALVLTPEELIIISRLGRWSHPTKKRTFFPSAITFNILVLLSSWWVNNFSTKCLLEAL
jgi:hypothetical protein